MNWVVLFGIILVVSHEAPSNTLVVSFVFRSLLSVSVNYDYVRLAISHHAHPIP